MPEHEQQQAYRVTADIMLRVAETVWIVTGAKEEQQTPKERRHRNVWQLR